MRWVDTHGHLYLLDEPAADVVARAVAVGVAHVVCPGIDLGTSLASRDLAAAIPGVSWTAGVHPHEASIWPAVADRIAEAATEAVAVGECGLDWYRNLAPRVEQLAAFRAQAELAVALDKPLLVHCRDAFSDVLDVLGDTGAGSLAVLHSWTGGRRWTRRFAELGVTFSYSGIVTYPGAEAVRLGAVEVPRERVMVETDTPYLTPEPDRARRNEPANVVRVGEALAALWGVDVADVAALTTARATAVFGVPGG